MGVIQQRFSLLTHGKAVSELMERVGGLLQTNGLTERQTKMLCEKICQMARHQMGNKYTVMGGYSQVDQLVDKALDLMNQLDKEEKLEELVDENSEEKSKEKSEIAEPDLEDAYHVADSISFVGSEKQIKWAHNIATNNSQAIAQSGLSSKQLPQSAKWWIENRSNIYSALKGLSHA